MTDYRSLVTFEHLNRVADWLEGGPEIIPYHEFDMGLWEGEGEQVEDGSIYCHTSACLYGSAVMLAMADHLGRKPFLCELRTQSIMYTWYPPDDWFALSPYHETLDLLFNMHHLAKEEVVWLYRHIDSQTGLVDISDWQSSPFPGISGLIELLENYGIEAKVTA